MKSFVISSILIFFLFNSCQNSINKYHYHLNEGIKEVYNADYDAAEKNLRLAIKYDKEKAEPYYYFCIIEFHKTNYKEAMKWVDISLEKNEKYGEAYKTKAQIYFLLNDRTNACKYYRLAEKYGIKNLSNHLKYCP